MDALETSVARKPEAMQALMRELDTFIRATAPSLEPGIKWGNLTYHRRAMPSSNVCALVAHAQHLNLQVWGAATLPDPLHLLTGSGKRMRHIRLVPGGAMDRAAIGAILRAAVEAPPVGMSADEA